MISSSPEHPHSFSPPKKDPFFSTKPRRCGCCGTEGKYKSTCGTADHPCLLGIDHSAEWADRRDADVKIEMETDRAEYRRPDNTTTPTHVAARTQDAS